MVLVLLALVLLAGCATTPEPLSYRQQLDIYKDMKIRLYQAAAPIKNAAASKCPKTGIDTGVLTHRLSDYPQNMREVAQSYWGLKDDDTVLFETEPSDVPNCTALLILDYGEIPNAHTDGVSIFITPALLNQIDDLSLALIIAHELGHIAHGHLGAEPSEGLERQADRFALLMLARAGLDYKKAAAQDAASKPPHISGGQPYLDTTKRADYFRKVVTEIEKLQADGNALVP